MKMFLESWGLDAPAKIFAVLAFTLSLLVVGTWYVQVTRDQYLRGFAYLSETVEGEFVDK